MIKEQIIKQTAEHVKEMLAGKSSDHDWWHIYRVWKNAVHIGKRENADLFVIELAALLHDIADWKFNAGNDDIGPKLAREWLENLFVAEEVISHVCRIVKGVTFKGAGVESKMETTEGMVVQDADRLDAIGAIGIGRAFTFGGSRGLEMYNPDIKLVRHETFEQYKKKHSPTVNHFYEKLLLLKDLMNTATAKKMAERRHKVMEEFLDEFFREWEGND